MELVAAVTKRKLASIHVIGMEEYPFELVLGKDVGKGLKHVRIVDVISPCYLSALFIKEIYLVSRITGRQIPYAMQD